MFCEKCGKECKLDANLHTNEIVSRCCKSATYWDDTLTDQITEEELDLENSHIGDYE